MDSNGEILSREDSSVCVPLELIHSDPLSARWKVRRRQALLRASARPQNPRFMMMLSSKWQGGSEGRQKEEE